MFDRIIRMYKSAPMRINMKIRFREKKELDMSDMGSSTAFQGTLVPLTSSIPVRAVETYEFLVEDELDEIFIDINTSSLLSTTGYMSAIKRIVDYIWTNEDVLNNCLGARCIRLTRGSYVLVEIKSTASQTKTSRSYDMVFDVECFPEPEQPLRLGYRTIGLAIGMIGMVGMVGMVGWVGWKWIK